MKNKTNILVAVSIFIAVFILIVALVICWGSSLLAIPATTTNQNAMDKNSVAAFQTLTALAQQQPANTLQPSPVITFAPLPFTVEATPNAQGSILGSGGGSSGSSGSQGIPGAQGSPGVQIGLTPTSNVDLSYSRRIYFATDATSASVIGGVAPDQILTYFLYIVGEQPAQITLTSENNDMVIAIYDPNKYELLSPAAQSANWQGYFKKAGFYYINVHGGAATSKFTLSMSVAARVTFAPETSDAPQATEVKYKRRAENIVSYALHATAGQTMNVLISTPPEIAALTIWGYADGQFYARAEEGTTSFSMPVTVTQDYIIDIVPQTEQIVNYLLKIWIK